MQKPFNAEGLDLTFLFDAIYPDSSITKVNNVGAAPSAMSGFAPEQTTSLQQLISISISEALEPLLKPLGDFLSAWNTGSQSLPPKSSSTHSIPSEFGHGTQPSISDGSYGQLDSTDFVRSSAPKPVLAKRKANALDEAVASVAKKKCAFGVVGKKSLSTPDLEECSPEMQVKKEPTPGTLLSEFQSSSTEDHASMFLTPAHGQSERQPASSQGKATEDSSAGTESMEEQQHFAHTDAGELSSSREDQSEAWLIFAEGSAALKALFRDEPNKDKPCPTRNYFAEKPASLLSFPVVYERSFPRLPSGAPIGCAHVIDVSIYQNKTRPSIRVADLVVTFLFNYSLDLLYAFLNVTRHPEFVLTRIEVAGRECRNFSIERSDLTVTCTLHERKHSEETAPVEEEQYDEEALIKRFGAADHEKIQFICEMKPWAKWTTTSWSSGGVFRQAHNKENRRTVERYAHAFGMFILKSGKWMEGEGVTFEGGATSA